MSWQDLVIAVVIIAFTLTTVPMIRGNFIPPLMTSGPLTIGAAVLVVTYLTLQLWFSAFVETSAVILWGILMRRGLNR